MLDVLFIGSILIVAFVYFGYPASMSLIASLRPREVKKALFFPAVTLIITAHNEEKRIRQKLENTLGLEYPQDKLEVLIASDGSTDATNSIVKEYTNKGVCLLPLHSRNGKEAAQKAAVDKATGEVLVFSDAATIIEPDALTEIVANFADTSVGCVSSVDKIVIVNGDHCGEGAYVRYEMWLRALETRANSVVGLSGSFFAARKEVCHDFSEDMQSDFRTVLNSMKMGLRGVSDPAAVGRYLDTSAPGKEFDRKVRTILRGLTVFFRNLEFLNPIRYGLFSYQYLCHKLLRWSVPLLLLMALLSNVLLAVQHVGYSYLLIAHVIFYTLGATGLYSDKYSKYLTVKLPMYFIAVNAAIVVAY